jgi:predicted aspartyl protease
MRLSARAVVATAALVGGLCLIRGEAEAACRFVKFASLKADMSSGRPMIDGSVEKHPMRVLVDSGAVATFLTRGIAEKAGLTLRHSNHTVFGVDGDAGNYGARVDEVSFGPVRWERATLSVLWRVNATTFDALLGADFLLRNDIEMALSEGEIHFFNPQGCEDAFLAYWSADALALPLAPGAPDDPRAVIEIEVNGRPMHALIDSGATHSAIDEAAAARVGVTRASAPGGGASSAAEGAGRSWVGLFERVAIGRESIGNVPLEVMSLHGAYLKQSNNAATAQYLAQLPQVVLGADFLKSHRVLIAMSQRRFYFSYLGGPVFLTDPLQ